MIGALKKIWDFAGEERKNINKSIVVGFFYAVFHMLQVAAIYQVVLALTGEREVKGTAAAAFWLLFISIIGRTAANCVSQLEQTHAGYFMAANKRIAIGNKLKRVPMGYFNQNSLGELTGIVTSVLEEAETTAPMVLVGMLGGLINSFVFTIMVLLFDWRMGLLVVAGCGIYLLVTSAMQTKTAVLAPKRQESAARLVEAVLEFVQGMGVVKSFNLSGRGDKKLRDALEYNRKTNLDIEAHFTPYVIGQDLALQVFSVLMMLAAAVFYRNGSMGLSDALMSVIVSFLVFAQIQSAGSSMAILRVASSAIDRANETDRIPEMDGDGQELSPHDHGIRFDDVRFSYGDREILHGITADLPDKTTTAVVGPSGSGKTTLCSLIARFWDVDGGSVKIGGRDVREYTLESLMDQISIVFQDVYLFEDTVENNIRFGRPGASREEVIEAAKKACCDEFIRELPNGYETVIGEGGASLSGGERQRISIARAILKDSPIILFDEVTANVDPENEDRLQKAIEELMKNKTILMIAHRLKTVRNADQILVLDRGRIVQRGRHETLMAQGGIYRDFVSGRTEAVGWKVPKSSVSPHSSRK